MNMGQAEVRDLHFPLELDWGPRDVTLLWVGNPQCSMPVEHFDFDWRAMGYAIEHHPHFPKRTNVSFVKKVDDHTIDVRFWERGAGETLSSGTSSVSAAAAAVANGWCESPVTVHLPGGDLLVELQSDGSARLTGPAEEICRVELV
jgi:diaminopimelate epimerase